MPFIVYLDMNTRSNSKRQTPGSQEKKADEQPEKDCCFSKYGDFAIPETSQQFSITPNRAHRIAGGAMGVVYKATLRGEMVAAKSHHALKNPDDYGLDDPVALKHFIGEIMAELHVLHQHKFLHRL